MSRLASLTLNLLVLASALLAAPASAQSPAPASGAEGGPLGEQV